MKLKERSKNFFILSAVLFFIFVLFTLCVKFFDVSGIGPNESLVGLSHINKSFHDLTGVNFTLYNITDWGGIIALVPAVIFAVVGFVQLIKRKKISRVDKNLLALGIFYVATVIVYLFFEIVVVNRRPVLIDGNLEASYPSSTTILAITFLLSLIYQIDCYIKRKPLSLTLKILSVVFCMFLVIVRLVCGVHWFTDIVAGIIISSSLLCLYYGLIFLFKSKENNQKSIEIKEINE